jgi:hypothetical protein
MKIYARKKLGALARTMAYYGLPITPNDLSLAHLGGKFKGKRAVIVGTGPSLRIEDLDRLDGWHSFSCNKIYLAFENTAWRPDFYSVGDVTIAEHCKNFDFRKELTKTKIINSHSTRKILKPDFPTLHYWYSPDFSIIDWQPGDEIIPPSTFGKGIIPGGFSVLIDQLQMAYLMGFTTVAIIGADLSYFGGQPTGERSQSGELIRYTGNEAKLNYFHKDYYKTGDLTTVPRVEEMRKAWEYCRLLFESSGRTLINASRKTELRSIERISFDDLFPARST